jgi:predicted transcriptional regulator of viral defense system
MPHFLAPAPPSRYSYAELERMTRTGALTRIRRGAYANGDEPDPHREHRRLLEATWGQTTAESVVSHHSAAVLHGLPVRIPLPPRVHLTRARPSGGKIRTYVHVHVAALSELEVCEIDAFKVTSVARTVVDLARVLDHAEAVALGDAAMSLWALARRA